jgi:retinol dehydrogenase 12
MIPPLQELSKQGYDLQFATNVLGMLRLHRLKGIILTILEGHFYLTKLLLPTLIATAKTSPEGVARVISVSSGAHHGHSISYDTLRQSVARQRMSTETLYAQSKFGVVVFAKELARRYGDEGIVSISLNPGNMKTPLQRQVANWQKRLIVRLFVHTSETH